MARKTEQAFPFLKPHEDVGTYIPGMTLRDYFAAQALPQAIVQFQEGHPEGWIGIASVAYKVADAMMEARK